MMIRRCVVLALVALCIGACQAQQPARTCDEVSARVLRNIMLQPGSPTEARTQIATAYSVPFDQIVVTTYKNASIFYWGKDGADFSLEIGGDYPVHGGVGYQSRPPSIGMVLDCLGTPDSYLAAYERVGHETWQNELSLNFYFIKLGIVAHADIRSDAKQPPKLSPEMPMGDYGFVYASSPEETMTYLNYDVYPVIRQDIKPWPGKLEDVVVEIEPDLK